MWHWSDAGFIFDDPRASCSNAEEALYSTDDVSPFSAYDSELYSDLTVECGMYSFKLHKTIVCPQSDFFRKVVREEGWLVSDLRFCSSLMVHFC